MAAVLLFLALPLAGVAAILVLNAREEARLDRENAAYRDFVYRRLGTPTLLSPRER